MSRKYYWQTLSDMVLNPVGIISVTGALFLAFIGAVLICVPFEEAFLFATRIYIGGFLLTMVTICAALAFYAPLKKLNELRAKIQGKARTNAYDFYLKPAVEDFIANLVVFERGGENYPSAQAKRIMALIMHLTAEGLGSLSALSYVRSAFITARAVMLKKSPVPEIHFQNGGGAFPVLFWMEFIARNKRRTFAVDITTGEVWGGPR